ncbi:MAG: hypothetical protein ABWZ25_18435 [Chitinophagaceae bacterium]
MLTDSPIDRFIISQITPDTDLHVRVIGEKSRYRDLDPKLGDEKFLRAYDLFSLFTASIIEMDVTFIR